MTGLALGAAVLIAVLAVGYRRWLRARELARRPGATLQRAIAVRRFDEIEDLVEERRCRCGAELRLSGESSRQEGDRRFRIVRLVCGECGRDERVFFDVTEAFH